MTEDQKYGLGRVHRIDYRDLDFPMHVHFSWWDKLRARLRSMPLLPPKEWLTGSALDQGTTPHCVGYAGFQFLRTQPNKKVIAPDVNGDEIYYDCKVEDGEPGRENGSDSRSLMKVLTKEGYVVQYVWAQTPRDLTQWLLTKGPVLMGTPWREEMFTPDGDGRIWPHGNVSGGHEYLAHGYDPRTKLVKCMNSWGEGWGKGGHFYIHIGDLWRLVREGGDACAALEEYSGA